MKALRERTEAKAERDTARARLFGTVDRVRSATAPSALADLVKTAAKTRTVEIASASGKAVKRRPEILIGALAGALLYLFRKPLIGAVRRLTKEKNDG